MGRSHLSEHLIQPLQRSIQVNLDPAGSRGDVLSVVFRPPALHEAQANSTHLGQLKNCLVAVCDWLTEHLSKLLVVEDLETAAWWDLAHSGGVEAVVAVAVTTLHENAALWQAFCKHLASYVVQVQTCVVGRWEVECGSEVEMGWWSVVECGRGRV